MIESAAGFGNLIHELCGVWVPLSRFVLVQLIRAIARWRMQRSTGL